MKASDPRPALLVSFLLFMAALAAGPLLGPTPLDWSALLAGPSGEGSVDRIILFSVRLPRVLTALLSGASLAAAGLVFQTVLRNPLASPYTLGVAGGASLGAVASFVLPWTAFLPFAPPTILAAFAGALLSLLLVLGVSAAIRPFSTTTLILAGVTANFLFGALVLLLYYTSAPGQGASMMHWLLGGLDVPAPGAVPRLALSLLPFFLLLLYLGRDLDLLAAGTEWAGTKGVDAGRVSMIAIAGASLLTGAAVAHTGPIGFIGLLVPHALRPFVGMRHRELLVASAFAGGAFLVFCDAGARTLLAPAELPVGILTALLGGPFLLWLLTRMKNPFGAE